jgi:conflict system pore-forming effector with SLATT domain
MMKLFRNDISVAGDSFETAAAYYSEIRKGFREKANHNKHESNFAFFGTICFTLAAPLFVTMGEGWFYGKALPATLSVLAAGATAWLQIRKPQRLSSR